MVADCLLTGLDYRVDVLRMFQLCLPDRWLMPPRKMGWNLVIVIIHVRLQAGLSVSHACWPDSLYVNSVGG